MLFRMLLVLVLILGIFPPALSAQGAFPQVGGQTQELVVNLPEDGGKCYLSVVGTPGEANFERVKGWFTGGNASMTALARKTHFHVVPTSSGAAEKYRDAPGYPLVRLQDSQGHVLAQVSGKNVPISPNALANSMNSTISTQCIFSRRRCEPQPSPQPAPVQPDVVPFDDVQPDVIPDVEPESSGPSLLIALLAALAGGGYGAYEWWKKSYFSP